MTISAPECTSRLEGKVVAITGAGSGIGRATAQVMARAGAHLLLCDVNGEYLSTLLIELPKGAHRAVVGDVATEQASIELTRVAREAFGGLDVLVGNAGIMCVKDVTEISVEEFDRLMAVNVRGMVLACKHAIPLMVNRGCGTIVIVSSASGFRGQEFDGVSTFAYNMTKAAVRQLATSLATRYAREGIRVNSVAPGVTRTHQLMHCEPNLSDEEEEAMFAGAGAVAPLGRYAQASEIAKAIAFLASDEASYVTGATLAVDGGLLARL